LPCAEEQVPWSELTISEGPHGTLQAEQSIRFKRRFAPAKAAAPSPPIRAGRSVGELVQSRPNRIRATFFVSEKNTMQYDLIVILGPNIPGGESYSENPINANHREALEEQGVKFIGDGKSTVDYMTAIKELSAKNQIKPDTIIYFNAHGVVKYDEHYMQMGVDTVSTGPSGPGASSPAYVLSTQALARLQSNIKAYDNTSREVVPWIGGVFLSSCFSGQLLQNLSRPDAPKINRKVLANSDNDKVALSLTVDGGDLASIECLLRNKMNFYKYIAEDLNIVVNAPELYDPDLPYLFKSYLPEKARDYRGNTVFEEFLEHHALLNQALQASRSSAGRSAIERAMKQVMAAVNESRFIQFSVGEEKWWRGVAQLINQYESTATGTEENRSYSPKAITFFESVSISLAGVMGWTASVTLSPTPARTFCSLIWRAQDGLTSTSCGSAGRLQSPGP
jgi:hypothetical protein